MMIEMFGRFCFKGTIQQMIFVTNIAANAASRVFEYFARGVLLSIWIIITAVEGYNTCDLIRKSILYINSFIPILKVSG